MKRLIEIIAQAKQDNNHPLSTKFHNLIKSKLTPQQIADTLLYEFAKSFRNIATAEFSTHHIEVQEIIWNKDPASVNNGNDIRMLGQFNFNTNNFDVPNAWVRKGSKFHGKGPMGIKEALVLYSTCCQDCDNLAGLMDCNDMDWDAAIAKGIRDKVFDSTECEYCKLWVPETIQKYVFDVVSGLNKLVEGIYRNGRRFHLNILPATKDAGLADKVAAIVNGLMSNIFGHCEAHLYYTPDEATFRKGQLDIGLKCDNIKTEPLKAMDFTKIWPKWRKGPVPEVISAPKI